MRFIAITVLAIICLTGSVSGASEPVAYTDSFRIDSTGNLEVNGVGFEPDMIRFHVTNTISSFDIDQTHRRERHGQGHGFASCNASSCENVGLTVASGSDSMNGQAQASSDSYSVLQLITNADGTQINGRIEARVTEATADGFKLDVDQADSNQFVTFTAYNFGEDSETDVGFFQSPTSPGVKTVETGNSPDFLSVKMTPQITSVDQTLQNPRDDGWMHGFAARRNGSISQVSLGVTSYSNNRNHHFYTSSDSEIIRLIRDTNKGDRSISDRLRAKVSSFNSTGFSLDFTDTNNGQLGMYAAVETDLKPEVGFFRTPTTTGRQVVDTELDLAHVQLASSNSIPNIGVDGFSGSKQNDNNRGWMFGAGTPERQRSMMLATNSNSENGHATTSSDSQIFRMLYSEQDEDIRGREAAALTGLNGSIELDWSTVETSGTYVPSNRLLTAYYGFSRDGSPSFCGEVEDVCLVNQTVTVDQETLDLEIPFRLGIQGRILDEGLNTLNSTRNPISGEIFGSVQVNSEDRTIIEPGARLEPSGGDIVIN